MWKILFIALLPSLAFATNKPEPPKPSVTSASSSSTSASQSKAASTSKSVSSSHSGPSTSISKGGSASGGKANASSDNAVNMTDGSSYTDGSNLYVLPAPVFTPPLPIAAPTSCITTSQRALGVGFSALSMADALQDPDKCIAIEMHNLAVKQCQWQTAKQIRDLLTAKVLPGFTANNVVSIDLTQKECDAWHAPKPTEKVVTKVVYKDRPDPCAHPSVGACQRKGTTK